MLLSPSIHCEVKMRHLSFTELLGALLGASCVQLGKGLGLAGGAGTNYS